MVYLAGAENSCIYKENLDTQNMIWDNIQQLTSIWCKAHGLLSDVSLNDMLKDLEALLH